MSRVKDAEGRMCIDRSTPLVTKIFGMPLHPLGELGVLLTLRYFQSVN